MKPTACKLQHYIASNKAELLELRSAWENAFRASGGLKLPLSWSWFYSWWCNFGPHFEGVEPAQLRVHWFESDGKVRAIFPMYAQRVRARGFPANSLRAMSNGHSPYWDAVLSPDLPADDVWNAFNAVVKSESPDYIVLRRLRDDSQLNDALRTEGAKSLRCGAKNALLTPIVDTTGDWDTYIAQRSRKYRQNLRRKLRDFDADDGLTVCRYILQGSDDQAFEDAVSISANSWKVDVGNDLASNTMSRSFLRQQIDYLVQEGKACIWMCRKDGHPIAYELHFVDDSSTFPIRADYDRRFSKLSPGSLVEYHALRSAFNDPSIRAYDCCADDYKYLRNLTNDYRYASDVYAFPRRPVSQLLGGIEFDLIPFAQRLWSEIRSLRGQGHKSK